MIANRKVSGILLASCLVLSTIAHAQDPYSGLARTEQPRNAAARTLEPGVDYPLLELDSNFKLIGAKTTLWLTQKGERKMLGILDQGLLRAMGGIYSFRKTKESPILATLDWKDVTLDPAGKLMFKVGNEAGAEVGRVRQRTVFSIGTGLDVYRKGDRPVGYVDEKAGKHLENLFIPSVFTQKYYSFERLAYRQQSRTVQRGLFNKHEEKVTDTITDRTEAFRFLGGKLKVNGPSGIFTATDGTPILAVKGDWWVSKHIFDLVVKRVEAEGTPGAIATGIGVLLGGETDEQRRQRIQRENELVRNPSAYLGSFLVGLIYFQEFRDAVGVQLPIAE
ncbi:MAG: hypothetical protein HY303_15925 [Candidatus Wallbacteria bacterium]|nr:hypothetical protein [Candidatus Wallbacteria bacterium]